ncbi:MAG: hypothetical protein GTO08_03460, partial [Deltaproteobacteria bacterium]|nr:hypothetical protein [Deltaproteobacteria bacterium]
IRAAARDGARVAVLGNAKGLDRFSTMRILSPVFQEAEVLEMLLTRISTTTGPRGEKPAADKRIRELARERTETTAEIDELHTMLLEGESVAIVLGMDLVMRSDGHRA